MKYGIYSSDRERLLAMEQAINAPGLNAKLNSLEFRQAGRVGGSSRDRYFGPVQLTTAASGSNRQKWNWTYAQRNPSSRNLGQATYGSAERGTCTIPPGVPAYAGANGMLLEHQESGGLLAYLFIPISQWPVNVHLTTALPGGEMYNATLYIPPSTDIDPSANMSVGNIGTTGVTCIAMNLHGIGKSTHDLVYKTLETQRDYTGIVVRVQADGMPVVAIVGTCCLLTCCNTICFTVYTGMVEGVPTYSRTTFYDAEGDGTYGPVGGGSATLTKVGSDWVFYLPDWDTWTAPADENGCVPLDIAEWADDGGSGYLAEVKCGDCSVEDCCESYCLTTDDGYEAIRHQLPVVTTGVKWASGADSIIRGETLWTMVVRSGTYTAPVEGNPCPPLVLASWTHVSGSELLVSIECGTCGPLYRQASICDGDTADVWMTVDDATTVGTDAFKITAADTGICYYFNPVNEPRITPGTVYAVADVTRFADCEECADSEPCCDTICVTTASGSYSLVRGTVDTNTWSDGATPTPNQITKNVTTGGWELFVEGGNYSASASDCPPTSIGGWTFYSGDDVLTGVYCGPCPPPECETCASDEELTALCPETVTVTISGLTGTGAELNGTYTLTHNVGTGHYRYTRTDPPPEIGTHTTDIILRCGNVGVCTEECVEGTPWLLSISLINGYVSGAIWFKECTIYCCPPLASYIHAATCVAGDPYWDLTGVEVTVS